MRSFSSEQILEESGISVAPPKQDRSSQVLMLAPLAPAIAVPEEEEEEDEEGEGEGEGEEVEEKGEEEEEGKERKEVEQKEEKTSMLFALDSNL